ncbi:peptidase like family domain-containing protein [Ditylenchus destructor]|nr:peptidase like family domain-containing protein [Ditylenchus destructor]
MCLKLVALEQHCFTTDRLSSRSFQWMVSRAHGQLLVADNDGQLLGYGLVLFHRGTSLARLYSIAIAEHARGLGLGKQLLARIETIAVEPTAPTCAWRCAPTTPAPSPCMNAMATGVRPDQRLLRRPHRCPAPGETHRPHQDARPQSVPYYQQTTDFTCGAACLLMAMGALVPKTRGTTPRRAADLARSDHRVHDRRPRRMQPPRVGPGRLAPGLCGAHAGECARAAVFGWRA